MVLAARLHETVSTSGGIPTLLDADGMYYYFHCACMYRRANAIWHPLMSHVRPAPGHRIVRVDLKFPTQPEVSEAAKDFIRKVGVRSCVCVSVLMPI